MKNNELIHIGTSGWHYKEWKGPFYPEKFSSQDFLEYYTHYFHTVEINNSFYRLPSQNALKQWRDCVSSDFIFTVKASRYITHMKKLQDPTGALNKFFQAIKVLEDKIGVVLFQLPPHWKCNPVRLSSFLKMLRKYCKEYRYAFEFRDPSWFNNQVYEELTKHKVAFCIYDLGGQLSPKKVTTDFVYIRLHGPKRVYCGNYSLNALAGWAGAFSTWCKQGKEIYCYFDNDEAGYAAQNALKLQEMIRKK